MGFFDTFVSWVNQNKSVMANHIDESKKTPIYVPPPTKSVPPLGNGPFISSNILPINERPASSSEIEKLVDNVINITSGTLDSMSMENRPSSFGVGGIGDIVKNADTTAGEANLKQTKSSEDYWNNIMNWNEISDSLDNLITNQNTLNSMQPTKSPYHTMNSGSGSIYSEDNTTTGLGTPMLDAAGKLYYKNPNGQLYDPNGKQKQLNSAGNMEDFTPFSMGKWFNDNKAMVNAVGAGATGLTKIHFANKGLSQSQDRFNQQMQLQQNKLAANQKAYNNKIGNQNAMAQSQAGHDSTYQAEEI